MVSTGISYLISDLSSSIENQIIIDSIRVIIQEITTPTKDSVLQVITGSLDYFKCGQYEKCVERLQIAIDWTWEQLHTGYWKDVSLSYRRLYSFVVLLMGLVLSIKGNYSLALAYIDKGLLLGAPVLGDSYLHKWTTTLTAMLNDSCKFSGMKRTINFQDSENKTPKLDITLSNTVPQVECPSLDVFKNKYMLNERPVIVKGCMSHWPAMSNRVWSVDYLKRLAGPRTVPVELGLRYTDENWSQKLMTVEEFIDRYLFLKSKEFSKSDSSKGYLAQHQLFDQIPELRKDICIPDYCSIGEHNDVSINAWFGPEGTISPLHYDPKHNLLAQVMGKKYIKLYSPNQTPYLYPHIGLLHNTSQVDVESPDLSVYPLFSQAKSMECLLTAGDMLYIPPTYWHYVRSLSISFSVSFWWQ